MPTYEYTCEACGNDWEAEQRISEPKLTDCPKCGAPKAKRLISGGNFMLKGGGWYADGYGNKPSSKSGGDSKPEAKSETKSSDSSSSPAPAAASAPAASSTSGSKAD
ncbi:MAG: Endoglucanase precursor [Myxococcaceae bacterium]|nr:Endoglucanase precursor [Myxococcaceae bacterium]